MEETFARALQFSLAGLAAFAVALWFAMSIWTFRDIERRSDNLVVQVLATLVVVLGFIPGIVIYLLLRPRETAEQRYQREVEDTYLAQEILAAPTCPRCDRSIRDEFLFCPDCGTSLRRSCAACGRLVDIDWRTCAYCGEELPARSMPRSTVERQRPASRPTPAAGQQPTDSWEVRLDADEAQPVGGPSRRSRQPSSAGQEG